jgi:predicted DNA-binding transcriptional regulator AlpA
VLQALRWRAGASPSIDLTRLRSEFFSKQYQLARPKNFICFWTLPEPVARVCALVRDGEGLCVGVSETFLRFRDLKRMGVCSNWQTLKRWTEKEGFPSGIKIGNTRLWPLSEVNAWLQSRRDGQEQAGHDKAGRVIARTARNLSAELDRMVRDLPEGVELQSAVEQAIKQASELQPLFAVGRQSGGE